MPWACHHAVRLWLLQGAFPAPCSDASAALSLTNRLRPAKHYAVYAVYAVFASVRGVWWLASGKTEHSATSQECRSSVAVAPPSRTSAPRYPFCWLCWIPEYMLGVPCQCSMLQGFQYAGGTVHGLKAVAGARARVRGCAAAIPMICPRAPSSLLPLSPPIALAALAFPPFPPFPAIATGANAVMSTEYSQISRICRVN